MTLAGRPPFAGAVYGAALSVSPRGSRLWAAGPGGLAVSGDGGTSWSLLDDRARWAVGTVGDRGWAAGPDGRLVTFRTDR